jgi:hypothetical protein
VRSDAGTRELYRIWQQTGERGHLPREVSGTITVNGRPKVLTAAERSDYQQLVGRLTRDTYRVLMRSDAYREGTDEGRAKGLATALSSIDQAARVVLFGHRPRTADRLTVELVRGLTAAR